MIGPHSADDEVCITVQWLPSGDARMTVDAAVYPRLSNTLQEVLNMVHEENERILGRPPVPEHFAGIHLVVLVNHPVDMPDDTVPDDASGDEANGEDVPPAGGGLDS